MVDNHILDYLTDSIKQHDYLQNTINANHPFPCGICQKNVASNQKYLDCISCNKRIHIKCNGTPTVDEYSLRPANDKTKWCCNKCLIIKNATIFPYGLENNVDLISIINCDYEITRKFTLLRNNIQSLLF